MLIGAFPSARFEVVDKMLVPCGNNLSPFGEEEYFNGRKVQFQQSRKSLNENYFSKLNIDPDNIWITDIVKIYLYPEKHIKNCRKINSKTNYVNTHKLFKKIASNKLNLKWLYQEIKICSPKLIITLGEVPARILAEDKKTKNVDLLSGKVFRKNINGEDYNIAHLAHPEICRINKTWRENTNMAIHKLGRYIVKNKLNT